MPLLARRLEAEAHAMVMRVRPDADFGRPSAASKPVCLLHIDVQRLASSSSSKADAENRVAARLRAG